MKIISFRRHTERHRGNRIGWLRAAVLGANDGIVLTASLAVGVAAAGTSREGIPPAAHIVISVSGASLAFLAALGFAAARVGGANVWVGASRITFWRALAMATTAGVDALLSVIR